MPDGGSNGRPAWRASSRDLLSPCPIWFVASIPTCALFPTGRFVSLVYAALFDPLAKMLSRYDARSRTLFRRARDGACRADRAAVFPCDGASRQAATAAAAVSSSSPRVACRHRRRGVFCLGSCARERRRARRRPRRGAVLHLEGPRRRRAAAAGEEGMLPLRATPLHTASSSQL